MRFTPRKLLSLLLILAVALAPVRFGLAGMGKADAGGDDRASGAAVMQAAMAGCAGLGSPGAEGFAAEGGCPLMGDSAQGGEGCAGSGCDACPGAQSLATREFSLPRVASTIYLPAQSPRLAGTPAAADFRPPKTLS